MARIRSIKPEFWDDRKLAKRTSRDARLLYIALWNLADEHGRVNGDPQWIKGQVFPYEDDLDAIAVEKLLAELEAEDIGAVVAYEADGDPYLYLPKLAKHQRLEPEKVASRLPAPPAEPCPAGDREQRGAPPYAPRDGETARGARERYLRDGWKPHGADSSEPRADSPERDAETPALLYGAGSRTHVAGSRGAARSSAGAPPRSHGDGLTEIPDDFAPTDAMRRWANQTYPGLDLDHETAQFTRYWRSEGKRKKSWADAWQKWIADSHKRMSQARSSPPAGRRQQTPDDDYAAAMQRIQARKENSDEAGADRDDRAAGQVGLPPAAD